MIDNSAINSIFFQNHILSSLSPKFSAGKSENNNNSEDGYILDLSNKAKEIIAQNNTSVNVQKSSSIVDLAKEVNSQISEVEKKITRLLLSHQISPKQKISFEIDTMGKIAIKGNTEDKEKIENILNQNSSLVSEIKQMLNSSSNLAMQKTELKYKASIKMIDQSDDEDKEKKKLELEQKYVQVMQNIRNISNQFSMSGGELSVESLSYANGLTFSV